MKKTKLLTFNSFNSTISKYLSNNKNLLLAISGGMDSVALFHLCLGLRPKHKLYAVHINHGLRSESIFEQKFVKNLCKKYKIPTANFGIFKKFALSFIPKVILLFSYNSSSLYSVWIFEIISTL